MSVALKDFFALLRWPGFFLLSAALLLAACGGGDAAGGDGIGVETFEDYEDPTATPPPSGEELISGLLDSVSGVSPQLSYLHYQDIYLKELNRLNRDFIAASKLCREVTREAKDTVGLDWVIQVHRLLESWDFLYGRLTTQEVPEDLLDDYRPLHERMLRSALIMSFGVDQVLQAAILMGPSGRDYRLMSYDERLQFNSLCRQADFFLEGVDGEVNEAQRMVSVMLSEVNLE